MGCARWGVGSSLDDDRHRQNGGGKNKTTRRAKEKAERCKRFSLFDGADYVRGASHFFWRRCRRPAGSCRTAPPRLRCSGSRSRDPPAPTKIRPSEPGQAETRQQTDGSKSNVTVLSQDRGGFMSAVTVSSFKTRKRRF